MDPQASRVSLVPPWDAHDPGCHGTLEVSCFLSTLTSAPAGRGGVDTSSSLAFPLQVVVAELSLLRRVQSPEKHQGSRRSRMVTGPRQPQDGTPR